jgi:ATP-dependent exoDNAse (exonuclease V) alpha subunit
MQYPIQLATTCTIYQAQGLTFDHLAFDLNGVYKHGLTYTTLSHIKNKENLYLLQPLQMKIFQIDPSVAIEMH